MIIHLPTHILGGVFYQNLMGYSPNDLGLWSLEVTGLEYLFEVLLPINLFLFIYFYYLATGLNQLITKNKRRFPIALVISFFGVLGIQNFIMYILFRTDIMGLYFELLVCFYNLFENLNINYHLMNYVNDDKLGF